jgi:hypothetical protein
MILPVGNAVSEAQRVGGNQSLGLHETQKV